VGLILSGLLPIRASTMTAILNIILMILAFFVLGRQFAIRTFVGSALTTGSIALFGMIPGMERLNTGVTAIDLVLAVLLIAAASAILFTINASSGGTDIVAMIIFFKKPGIRIGRALFLADCAIVIATGLVLGLRSGITSMVGLMLKCLLVDSMMKFLKKKLHKQE
jgi:uncharacterized membrane-anchored protein YitT (DUF2179 family)